MVEMHYQLLHYGHFPASMYFEFCADPPTSSKPFCIVREMEAVAMTQLAMELAPTSPYSPRQGAKLQALNIVVDEGEPPERWVHTDLPETDKESPATVAGWITLPSVTQDWPDRTGQIRHLILLCIRITSSLSLML